MEPIKRRIEKMEKALSVGESEEALRERLKKMTNEELFAELRSLGALTDEDMNDPELKRLAGEVLWKEIEEEWEGKKNAIF